MEGLMQVEISLFEENSKGPGMWFLGVPPNPKIALNFNSPGPVTVNFDELSEAEKRHIIVSVNMRRIRTSVSYADLMRNYSTQLETPVVEQLIREGEINQQTKSIEEENAAKRVSREQYCVGLMALGLKSLRSEIEELNTENQEDLLVLKTILGMEKSKPKKQQRASVLKLLVAKLQQHNVEVISELEKSSKLGRIVDPFRPYDKLEVQYVDQIEEGDQEIIQIEMSDPTKIKEKIKDLKFKKKK
jgi:hypothetical protein